MARTNFNFVLLLGFGCVGILIYRNVIIVTNEHEIVNGQNQQENGNNIVAQGELPPGRSFDVNTGNQFSPERPPDDTHPVLANKKSTKQLSVGQAQHKGIPEVPAQTRSEWIPPVVPDDIAHLDQNDHRLARHIREHWVQPPFVGTRKLEKPLVSDYSQRGQSSYVDKHLNGRTGGFFIECGAADGENLSNSLYFEKERNWTGLLIEANPTLFKRVRSKRRNAYTLNACLSPDPTPSALEFRMADFIGGLVDHMEPGHKERVTRQKAGAETARIQCFPLAAILRALNVTHVDYFSLDIEGAEYDVIKSFPFDDINVDVMTIEYNVSGGGPATEEKLAKITELMVGRYRYRRTDYSGNEDVMFSKI